MTLGHLRPDRKRCLLEPFSVKPIGSESIHLPPHINEGAILRAVPIDQTRQLRAGRLKVLHCLAIAQMAHVMVIYKVKNSLLSRIHDEIGSRNQHSAGTIEICIASPATQNGIKMRPTPLARADWQ